MMTPRSDSTPGYTPIRDKLNINPDEMTPYSSKVTDNKFTKGGKSIFSCMHAIVLTKVAAREAFQDPLNDG